MAEELGQEAYSADHFLRRHGSHSYRQNGVIQPLLTDLYQITMAYAYWKAEKIKDTAVFDLFFRKNPFGGEFTIFGGLEECLRFLENFHYSPSDITYLKATLPTADPGFFTYLSELTADDIKIYAIDEGSVVFPRVPLLRIEGPLIVAQLLETTLLTLVNYASLVATNATRYRLASGPNIELLEFGLRRAQGPDGGLSASKYSYMGGFDGTSNVLAGKLYGIPVKGTHAHAYVSSFSDLDALPSRSLPHKERPEEVHDFINLCRKWKSQVTPILHLIEEESSDGELAAFASYAIAFPNGFLALVDTYDTVRSGLLNFVAVALALDELKYKAKGIRIDSGDLAYLSNLARRTFATVADKFNLPYFRKLTIVASNDINEETIWSLNEQGHQIDCFGIGTHLVTCQRQPALGCVYKLVEINGLPKIKLSEDVEKVTLPGKKDAYRLFKGGNPIVDLMVRADEPAPTAGHRVLCRHPFHEARRGWAEPHEVRPLYKLYWADGRIPETLPSFAEIREHALRSIASLRQDYKRNLNPTPYKVSVSDNLFNFIHTLWLQNAPIGELS